MLAAAYSFLFGPSRHAVRAARNRFEVALRNSRDLDFQIAVASMSLKTAVKEIKTVTNAREVHITKLKELFDVEVVEKGSGIKLPSMGTGQQGA